MKTSEIVLSLIVGLGLLGGIGYGIKAFYERKLLRANAASTDATATAVIVAAARELVDPLRAELAKERKEHAEEVEEEHQKLVEVRGELEQAIDDCRLLRRELGAVRLELERVHADNLAYRQQLAELGH